MQLGASFSHRHLNYLNLNPREALKEFNSLGLKWIRIGCYWNEIEEKEGKFSFDSTDPLIEFCEKNKINIVLTVGMKAPRYPEYYIPDWLLKRIKLRMFSKISPNNDLLFNKTLKFLETTIKNFKESPAIKVWQIENEPLDFSGPKWWKIGQKFLEKEVDLVRGLDDRKIAINLWGNELGKRKTYEAASQLADIVGVDFYPRYPNPFFISNRFKKYIGPLDSLSTIGKILGELKSKDKEVWLMELQAEPWEKDELIAKGDNPPSFLPEQFEKNIRYALEINPDVLLLWGFEYWLLKKSKGDNRYWDEAKGLISKYS